MPYASASLASLIGSRLCHDLISPIGAIQNGLELISLSGGTGNHSPEMALIEDSCKSATARVKFFRVAFGSADSQHSMSHQAIRATLAAYSEGGRFVLDGPSDGEFPRRDVQLAFLALLCCESALPQGGEIRFDRNAAGWSLTATGARLKIVQAYWDHLNGLSEPGDLDPKHVQFALLALLSEERGQKIMATCGEDQITIKIA